jgi:hypothetical protein
MTETTLTASRAKHVKAARADIGWDKAPCIRLWDPDDTEYRYTLTPTEAAAFVRRMAGYIEQLLRTQQ